MDIQHRVENVAKLIHGYSAGMGDAEYKKVMGADRTPWDELEEWERRAHRVTAKKIIDYLDSFAPTPQMDCWPTHEQPKLSV